MEPLDQLSFDQYRQQQAYHRWCIYMMMSSPMVIWATPEFGEPSVKGGVTVWVGLHFTR